MVVSKSFNKQYTLFSSSAIVGEVFNCYSISKKVWLIVGKEKRDKKKIVNFEFYEVRSINKESKVTSYYSLFELLGFINSKTLDSRTISYREESARMNRITLNQNPAFDLHEMHFCRLRDQEPAKTSTISSELIELGLEDNEYIAEDINLLYDSNIHMLMIQRNMHSLSPSGVAYYFNEFLHEMTGNDDISIELAPVMDTDAVIKSKKKEVFRKITLRTSSDMDEGAIGNEALRKVFTHLKKVKGSTIEITISSNTSNAKLDSDIIMDVLETIEKDKDLFSKAIVSAKNMEESIEKFDLLKGKYRMQQEFNIPTGTILKHEAVLDTLIPRYKKSRSEIIRLSKSKI